MYPAVGSVTADLRVAPDSLQGEKAQPAVARIELTREGLRATVAVAGDELLETVADRLTGRPHALRVRVAASDYPAAVAAVEAFTGARVRQPFLPVRVFAGSMRVTFVLRVVEPE